jgi:Putative MetA-pathway of phenol degradation
MIVDRRSVIERQTDRSVVLKKPSVNDGFFIGYINSEGLPMRLNPKLAAAAAVALFCGTPVVAESPATDKSQYNLFNPTPDKDLRSFAPDRPAKGTGPTTVDAGRIVVELEAINYARQKSNGVQTTTWVGPNPTLKIGLTDRIDFQINWAPFQQVKVHDSIAGTTDRFSGSTDLFLRSKINLWGNEGGKTAFAIVPFVKAPTAPENLGNRATEAGVILPFSLSLGNDISLAVTSEVDHLRNSVGSGYHQGYVNSIGLSGPLMKDVTLTGELWSSINRDPGNTIRQYSFDTALAWMARPDLQFDVGANIGLNSETPALQLYTGVSRRF